MIKPIVANIIYNDRRWEVELLSLSHIKVWINEVEIPNIRWDRCKIFAPSWIDKDSLQKLTLALKRNNQKGSIN